jgi:flagellar hook protein FlgE
MPRAMNSAISGLKSMQTWLDVVANNVVNSNSTAYKGSRVTFQDLLSQTERSASGPSGSLGGINAQQIGLGLQVGGVQTLNTQGALQTTGRITDFAIAGEGFFLVNDGNRDLYTRDGSFDITLNGNLVHGLNGFTIKGWQSTQNATTGVYEVDATTPPGIINLPMGQQGGANQTSTTTMVGNLDAATAAAATVTTTLNIIDSLGVTHLVTLTFTKAATPGDWTLTAAESDAAITAVAIASGGAMTFSSAGVMTSADPTLTVDFDAAVTDAVDMTGASAVTLDMDTTITQLSASSSVSVRSQDGFTTGTLDSFSVSTQGLLTGVYSNGTQRLLAQVAVARFPNPAGLARSGTNLFEVSANSGDPSVGTPGTGSRGLISNGSLEGSNVDLAQEFTNMILAQRGFQANGRVITTNDDILQELVNLKR